MKYDCKNSTSLRDTSLRDRGLRDNCLDASVVRQFDKNFSLDKPRELCFEELAAAVENGA